MTVIRVKKTENFVSIHKECLENPSLSFKAKGLWAYCMTRMNNWEFCVAHLSTVSKEKEDAIYSAIKELEAAGYCKKIQRNINGRFQPVDYEIYETSKLKKCLPQPDFPYAGFPYAGNPALINIDNNKSSSFQSEEEDIKESSLKRAKEKSKAAPPPHPPEEGPFKDKFEGKVKISQQNYDRLLAKFTLPSLIETYAEKLYRWACQNPDKFKKKKRHDMVIEDWIEKDLKEEKKPITPYASGLNDIQLKNWNLNRALVEDLIKEVPHKCGGLHFYYKAHVLKDKNDRSFDVSALIEHKSFRIVLQKHLKLKLVEDNFYG